MSTFKAIKSHLNQSYDEQNLTLLVLSYEIFEMSMSARSSIYWFTAKILDFIMHVTKLSNVKHITYYMRFICFKLEIYFYTNMLWRFVLAFILTCFDVGFVFVCGKEMKYCKSVLSICPCNWGYISLEGRTVVLEYMYFILFVLTEFIVHVTL